MKILGIANTVMLHLERDEATALVNVLDASNDPFLAKMARDKNQKLFDEIVRQIDICLKAVP